MKEPLLRVEEVARLLKISPRTVYVHAEEWGAIKVLYRDRISRRRAWVLRFPAAVIRALMEG